MKYSILIFFIFFSFYQSYAQKTAIALDKMNILYIGVDNPLSIAAENISFNSLIVKTNNGHLRKEDGKYIFFADSGIGRTDIILYTKVNNKLKEIGRSTFRLKRPPLPIFKIGSGRRYVNALEIAQQLYARAEWENIDIDATFNIEQFDVKIISKDTSRSLVKTNYGNALSEEIKQIFKLLKPDDVIVLNNIFIKYFGENHVELDPRIIIIKE